MNPNDILWYVLEAEKDLAQLKLEIYFLDSMCPEEEELIKAAGRLKIVSEDLVEYLETGK